MKPEERQEYACLVRRARMTEFTKQVKHEENCFVAPAVGKAPAKGSQHFNVTCHNIVGSCCKGAGQTDATFQRNISQHCWHNMLHTFGHPIAMYFNMLDDALKWQIELVRVFRCNSVGVISLFIPY